MTDLTSTPGHAVSDPDLETVRLSLTIRDSDASGEKALRQIGLGIVPLVLIEPAPDASEQLDAGALALSIDATDFGSNPAELADFLEVIADALRDATAEDGD